jgi:hypothetical protein
MRTTFALLSSFFMLLLVSAASADVIDQDAPTNNVFMAEFVQTDLAQSFQQASSIISGAGIFLEPDVGVPSNVTISLFDNLPNNGGNLLATASAIGTPGSYVDVFWNPVSITPDTTYYLVFDGNTSLGISGDTSDQYSRGQVYANAGFQSFPGFDYTFRTWTTSIPEPGTGILLFGSVVSMVLRRRRK